MFGGCVHSIDVIRAFGGDIKRVHAVANKGGLTEGYPIQDNFFLNVEFTSGVIGRFSGLYGIVHPPKPFTITLGLGRFKARTEVDIHCLMAMTAVSTLVPIIIFFVTQRTFLQEIVITGIKG